MAVAQGHCPNCGAPIEFQVGSSLAKVCEFCRHTVVRSDRGLSHLGKVADLANVPSLIAVGDEGTLGGRPFRVMGRVQLDHGKGPWDEYYVAFDYGQSWGWLAFAQGRWFATSPVPGIATPPYDELAPDALVTLGAAGAFRVSERRSAHISSAEGELPGAFPEGFVRHYADLSGAGSAFATIDFGDNTQTVVVFLGWEFAESQLTVTALGPRSTQKVAVTSLKCPSCGGDVPALSPGRSTRLGCPYCGAISDLAEDRVIAQQERARTEPIIPIGSRGTLGGTEYLCIAMLRRGSDFEGELYAWEEFLLWSQGIGFRWLVLDPETGWSFVSPANPAELDLSQLPGSIGLGERRFRSRNQNLASVLYVVGEVYWKCEIGETTNVADFVDGDTVLSREEAAGEVSYSLGTPETWPVVATAFNLPLAKHARAQAQKSTSGLPSVTLLLVAAAVIVFVILLANAPSGALRAASGVSGVSGVTGGTGVSGGFRGGGVFYGGK